MSLQQGMHFGGQNIATPRNAFNNYGYHKRVVVQDFSKTIDYNWADETEILVVLLKSTSKLSFRKIFVDRDFDYYCLGLAMRGANIGDMLIKLKESKNF